MKFHKKIGFCFALLLFVATMSNCRGGYSFTGTSLSPDIKTISIEYFQNMAPIVVSSLSNSFTEALTDKFRRQTKLSFVDFDGDLAFSGEIIGYDVTSINVQADEYAAQNRLSISVKVRCTNAIDEKQSFDKSFSHYADFDATQSLDSVQDDLIQQILETIIENIFNESAANW